MAKKIYQDDPFDLMVCQDSGSLVGWYLKKKLKTKLLINIHGDILFNKDNKDWQNAKWFNQLTYQNFEKHIYPTVTRMMRSYHKGMTLAKMDYEWIEKWNAQNVKEENSPECSDTNNMAD